MAQVDEQLKEMALETPTWLDLPFVEKVLQKSESDNSIQVINILWKSATSKGDNYTSNVIRITAAFLRDQSRRKITEEKSIIAKMSFEARENLVACQFHVEISMMSDTLDKMNELLGSKHRISGRCLYTQNEKPLFLILEDLAPLGFRMARLSDGFDLAHTILAIRGLARFHAASVVICEKDPKQKEMYSKKTFDNQRLQDIKNFFTTSTKSLANEVANWPEIQKYSEKIAKLSDHIFQRAIDVTKLSEDKFNVINHGDVHMNNMLFKYDNKGKPIDHIFVDFQQCVYTSPAIDLLYFLNSSLSPDVMENKTDIALNEYLGTLSATMKQLNCKTQPPTMEELKAILKRKASYGMIIAFILLPIMLSSKSEMTGDLFSTEFVNPGLKNELYKQLIIKRIPLYDEWGLLDV